MLFQYCNIYGSDTDAYESSGTGDAVEGSKSVNAESIRKYRVQDNLSEYERERQSTDCPKYSAVAYWTIDKLRESALVRPGVECNEPLRVEIVVWKDSIGWTFAYHVEGEIRVPCDNCLDLLAVSIDHKDECRISVSALAPVHEHDVQLEASQLDDFIIDEEILEMEDLVAEALNNSIEDYARCAMFGLTCSELEQSDRQEITPEAQSPLAAALQGLSKDNKK